MKHSEQFTSIAAALAAAAANFAPIQRNKTVEVKTRAGGTYTFTYATLDAIVAAVRPALSANGLVLVQSVVYEEITHSTADGIRIEREELLETRLIHSSGEWFSNTTPVLISDGENSAQAYGSGITYARRYGITQLLCIVADEDDDGNAAAGNVSRSRQSGTNTGGGRAPATITEKQANMLRAKLRGIGGNEVALCVFLKVEALEALPKARMDDAIAAIDGQEPALFQVAGSGGTSEEAARQRKAAHDAALAKRLESMQMIRYHLSVEVSDDIELVAAEHGWGDRHAPKAAQEWRALSADEQHALWLAPTKGGWFTTAEREALRQLLTQGPTGSGSHD